MVYVFYWRGNLGEKLDGLRKVHFLDLLSEVKTFVFCRVC
jgi:hypothetical protein